MTTLAQRSAEMVWHGTLASGSGTLTPGGGAFDALAIDWASRSEDAQGTSSPEELLAASLASCFAMAFSLTLTHNGTPPDELMISASCTLEGEPGGSGEEGYRISALALRVAGRVPKIDSATFQAKAREADAGCPVSNALRGNVALQLEATLE